MGTAPYVCTVRSSSLSAASDTKHFHKLGRNGGEKTQREVERMFIAIYGIFVSVWLPTERCAFPSPLGNYNWSVVCGARRERERLTLKIRN